MGGDDAGAVRSEEGLAAASAVQHQPSQPASDTSACRGTQLCVQPLLVALQDLGCC